MKLAYQDNLIYLQEIEKQVKNTSFSIQSKHLSLGEERPKGNSDEKRVLEKMVNGVDQFYYKKLCLHRKVGVTNDHEKKANHESSNLNRNYHDDSEINYDDLCPRTPDIIIKPEHILGGLYENVPIDNEYLDMNGDKSPVNTIRPTVMSPQTKQSSSRVFTNSDNDSGITNKNEEKPSQFSSRFKPANC